MFNDYIYPFYVLEIRVGDFASQSLLTNISPYVASNTVPCHTQKEVPDPTFRKSVVIYKVLRLMIEYCFGYLTGVVTNHAFYGGDHEDVQNWDGLKAFDTGDDAVPQ